MVCSLILENMPKKTKCALTLYDVWEHLIFRPPQKYVRLLVFSGQKRMSIERVVFVFMYVDLFRHAQGEYEYICVDL